MHPPGWNGIVPPPFSLQKIPVQPSPYIAQQASSFFVRIIHLGPFPANDNRAVNDYQNSGEIPRGNMVISPKCKQYQMSARFNILIY
jgi:hypothetical protein